MVFKIVSFITADYWPLLITNLTEIKKHMVKFI